MTERLISACGLVCSECDAFLATQAGDAAAIERVAAKWSEQFGATIPAAGVWCDGCMTGGERRCGHVDECKIRACVVGRDLANCAACDDYVCGMLEEFLGFAAESGARETLASLRTGS
jgi:hypothetical protein